MAAGCGAAAVVPVAECPVQPDVSRSGLDAADEVASAWSMSGPRYQSPVWSRAVDAAFGVDGEEGLAVGFRAEGADLGVQGAAEVAEGAGQVEAVQGVDAQRGGGDLAARARGR